MERLRPDFSANRSYDELPDLPPAGDIETKRVLKACTEARVALEGLRQAGRIIPNQSTLINTIPLLEAQASSEIENIVTTADELFRHVDIDGDSADSATKEALRYRFALRRGFEALATRPLGTTIAVDVCSAIKGVDMQVRRTPGTTLKNNQTQAVIYTPPSTERIIHTKLSAWERFIHDDTSLDPVLRMALAHYQFEAIHPFTDGNGRTGRILNLLMLVEQRLLDQPVLSLSRHIIRNKADYYRLLLEVTTEERWEPWVLYMLEAVRETATWTMRKIEAIAALYAKARAFVQERAPKVYSRELIDVLFAQPYSRINNVVEAGLAQRQTASKHLKALVDIGLLRELELGRDKLFVHDAYLRLVTSDTHQVPSYRV